MEKTFSHIHPGGLKTRRDSKVFTDNWGEDFEKNLGAKDNTKETVVESGHPVFEGDIHSGE